MTPPSDPTLLPGAKLIGTYAEIEIWLVPAERHEFVTRLDEDDGEPDAFPDIPEGNPFDPAFNPNSPKKVILTQNVLDQLAADGITPEELVKMMIQGAPHQ